jgi:hypothetical protein
MNYPWETYKKTVGALFQYAHLLSNVYRAHLPVYIIHQLPGYSSQGLGAGKQPEIATDRSFSVKIFVRAFIATPAE